MKAWNLGRYVLCIYVAATLLAGCGGSQPPIGASNAMPEGRTQAGPHGWSGSSGDLLYITTTTEIVVASFSQHKIIATIPGNWSNSYICSDPSNGNVFVTYFANPPTVVEFAHGGTTPIATLSVPSGYTVLFGCSVDPTTDNLAVGAEQGGYTHGAILVYAGGQGNATAYSDTKHVRQFSFPTYDDVGNLYADAVSKTGQFRFAELPVGKTQFTIVRLNEDLGFLQKIQWTNGTLNFLEYLGAHEPFVLYQAQVSGETATIVGSSQIDHAGIPGYFCIQGDSLYAFDGQVKSHHNRAVAEWPYPAGGEPSKALYGIVAGNNNGPIDLTVSVAPSGWRTRKSGAHP